MDRDLKYWLSFLLLLLLANLVLTRISDKAYVSLDVIYIALYILILVALFPTVKITEKIVYFEGTQENINSTTVLLFALIPFGSIYTPGVIPELLGFFVSFSLMITLIQRFTGVKRVQKE